MYSVIDLFAGAGGLSLGFQQTQKYIIKVAFENNPDMKKTYKRNHPGVEVMGDVCKANYKEIVGNYGNIDVVIGGPPCQGFSNANRQKRHAVNQNNMLVKQFIRAITELKPKAFVMENVSMLHSDVHRFYMIKDDEEMIRRCKIPVKNTPIDLLGKKYMFKDALKIVKNKNVIIKYLWPEEDYSELNIIYKVTNNTSKLKKSLEKHKYRLIDIISSYINLSNKDHINNISKKAFLAIKNYYDGLISVEQIKNEIEPAIMIQRMLSKALEIFENNILVDEYIVKDGISAKIRSYAVFDYIKGILAAPENDYVIDSGVLCAADFGAPQKRMRFVIMGIKRGLSTEISLPKGNITPDHYRTVRDAIEDLESVKPFFDLKDDINGIPLDHICNNKYTASLRDSNILKNHIITKTTDIALERFKAIKPGQNFHSLDEKLKTNTYTDVSRTQNTIYLRLNYDEPSGTVVNVRKSMWIHPKLDRAISVREAARLQTFPDSFVFCGTKDKQYQQVGNAVPPILAKSIALKMAKILDENV